MALLGSQVAENTQRPLWRVKPHYASKYGLPSEVPPEVQHKVDEMRLKGEARERDSERIQCRLSSPRPHAHRSPIYRCPPQPVIAFERFHSRGQSDQRGQAPGAAQPRGMSILFLSLIFIMYHLHVCSVMILIEYLVCIWPTIRPTIRPMQDEERSLKANTAKAAAFLVLKAIGIEGATAEEIQNLSTEKGFKTDWAPSSITNLKTVWRVVQPFVATSTPSSPPATPFLAAGPALRHCVCPCLPGAKDQVCAEGVAWSGATGRSTGEK